MREIRFRAWVEKKHKMLEDVSPFVVNVTGANEPLFSKGEPNKDCIFEQYTGLKDKNGKEIYEGDIIREIVDDGEEHVTEYEVVWNNELLNFSLKWKPSGSNFHEELWECNKSVEVIGNIHENPELLGGEE